MKKAFFTLALALGLGLAASAQEGGLFGYGPQRGGGENYSTDYNDRTGGLLNLPGAHGLEDDQTPLGTGTALLLGLGAAYLATKKRKNQKNPKHHNSKFFLIAAALTAGMISAQPMKVMGQTTHTIGWGSASGQTGTYTNFEATSGTVTNVLSFESKKNGSSSNPAYNSSSNELRLYYNSSGNGGSIYITPATGITITGAVMTTSTTPSVSYYVNGGSAVSVTASNYTYTISNISANTSLEIKNVNTTNTQLRIKTIAITYTVSSNPSIAAENVNINAGDTSGSITYQINNGTSGAVVTAQIQSGGTIANLAIDNEHITTTSVPFTCDANTANTAKTATVRLTYGNVTKDVTITQARYVPQVSGYNIDFEYETESYVDWTFTNMTSKVAATTDISAHGGTYYGKTNGTQTASIETNTAIATPDSLICFISKQTTNTTSSTWYIQVKTTAANATWTNVTSRSATDMNKGEWKKFAADLSNYTNVYVRVYYDGSTAVRNIDDLSLTMASSDPKINATNPEALAYNAAGGEFGYSITNPTSAALSAVSNSAWITNVVVDGTNSKVTFSTSTNPNTTQRTGTITLSYTGATDKVITITQNGAPAPTISADDIEIAYNATSGEISYTLNNPVANGSLSVSEEVAWISNATLNTTENKVTFTSETSEGVVARTGIVTITYTYNSQTVSKEVTVTQGVDATLGTAANPYTVAQARTFIDGLNGQTSADGKHVSGKISQVDSYNSNYKSITYWISDDGTTTNQLEVYSGKGINGADFSAVTDVATGAEVVVKGKLKYFSNQSVYEFDYNNELVSYTAPVVTTPTITVNPATVNATAAGIYVSTLDITYSNLTISDYNDFAIQFYDENDNELNGTAEPDWLVVLTASDIVGGETVYLVSYSVDANIGAARTAYFKVWALDGVTPVYSNKVTVTQAAYVPTPTDDDYVRISSLDQLTDGSIVIIAARYDDNNTNKYYAMANSTSGKPTGTLFTSSTLATNGNETLPSDITDDEDDFYWVVNVTKVGNNTYYTFTNPNGDKIGAKSGADFVTNGSYTQWTIGSGTSDASALVGSYTGFVITNTNYERAFALNTSYNFGDYATSNMTNANAKDYNYCLDFFVQMPTYTLNINHYTSQTTGWNLIASPAATVIPTADNGFLTNTYDLYYFDQSQENVWVNYKDNGAHSNTNPGFNLVAGKGYLYANSEDVTLYFSGTPYKGNGVIGLDYDGTAADDMKGLNLVGNPWSVSASVDKSFYIMNEYGSEIVSTNDNTVAQMQGIFVVANGENQTVTFTPAVTSAQPNNPAVTMNLTQNRGGVIDRAIVRFNGNDNLPKFQLFENSTKLYIAQDGKDYAIVGSEAQGEMPVCFQAKADGQYTISVDAENVEMGYLHLIDNITGADVDLLTNPSYTFNAKWDDYASRFRLVFSANNSNNAEAESDNFAFISNGQIILNGVNNNATLQVIDMLGRIVSSEQINGNSANLAPTASGVYVLRLINGTETKTQKIVVK